eukprot:Opistho-2@50287
MMMWRSISLARLATAAQMPSQFARTMATKVPSREAAAALVRERANLGQEINMDSAWVKAYYKQRRTTNFLISSFLFAFCAGVYVYTLRSVKHEDFSDEDEIAAQTAAKK